MREGRNNWWDLECSLEVYLEGRNKERIIIVGSKQNWEHTLNTGTSPRILDR